jgi:tetratricopeptide (TPR) repeat protein
MRMNSGTFIWVLASIKMKHYLKIFVLLLITSCAPSGTEEDNLNYEIEKSGLSTPSYGTEKYYIDQAYIIGALNKDSVGDYLTAILYLDSAIMVNPKNMTAYRLKAYASSLMGDKENALKIINQAIDKDSSDPENYISRAGLLVGLEKRDEALNDYYKAIELNPSNGRAHEAVGYMEVDKGNKAIGCEHLSKARDLGHLPENREADKYLCK